MFLLCSCVLGNPRRIRRPNYSSFRAEWDDPAASAIRSRELVGTLFFRHAHANDLRFAVDCRADQIPVYSDENRAKVEPGQSLLIDRAGNRIGNRAGPRDDAAHQAANVVGLLDLSYWRIVECRAGASGGVPERSLKRLASQRTQRLGELGMAEWFDHAGDMEAKQADEGSVLVLRIDRLAFVNRISNREVGVGGD